MITAVIQNGRQTAAIELPQDWCSLQYWLAQMDIREQPEHIPIGFDSDKAISVTLDAKSDIGKALTALFTEKNTLGEANVCTHMTENARMEIREELEQGLLYEQYTSPQELMDSIRSMTEELVTVTADYYCSLKFQMTDEEYGDWYEVDNGYGIANEDAIREKLQSEQEHDLNDMADYFDGSESAAAKLISAVWDVENAGGELYGVIHTTLREAFTPEEEQEWIDELVGQAADGFGEGFEQREIKTDDGEIYVSFWSDSADYFMENESDFHLRLSNQQQRRGMEMN